MKKAEIEKYVDIILSGTEVVFTQDTLDFLKSQEKKNLVLLNSNLGRAIRNALGLWNIKHKPKIVNGVDVSPNHPDAISQKIIESLWIRLNK